MADFPPVGGIARVGGGTGFLVPDASPFATIAERDTWATNNPDLLIENSTIVNVTGDGWYLWNGSGWDDADPIVQGEPGQDGGANLDQLTSGRVPYFDGTQLANSPMRRMDDGSAFIEGVTRIEAGTLAVGRFLNISEQGGFLGLTNALGLAFTLIDYRSPRDAPSSKPRRVAYTEAENRFDIQTVDTEVLTSPVAFNYTPTMLSRSNAFIGEVNEDITNLRFRITETNFDVVMKYWPSEAAWLDGVGQDFTAGSMVLDLDDSPLPLNTDLDLRIEIMFDTGSLLGDTNGVPALAAMIQRGQFVTMADLSDITAPVTPQPSFVRFSIQNQPTSVEAGTVISGDKVFNFMVERPDLLTGTLTISQDGTVLSQGSILPTATSATVTVTNTTLVSPGNMTTFTISGTLAEGGTITSHVTIRATQPNELAYYGIRSSNDFDTVAVGQLTSVDVTTNRQFDVTGALPNGSYVGILVPANMDLQRITTFATVVTDSFTKTENVRMIDGQQYISYVLQNNGGIDGQASYTVEI